MGQNFRTVMVEWAIVVAKGFTQYFRG